VVHCDAFGDEPMRISGFQFRFNWYVKNIVGATVSHAKKVSKEAFGDCWIGVLLTPNEQRKTTKTHHADILYRAGRFQ